MMQEFAIDDALKAGLQSLREMDVGKILRVLAGDQDEG